MVILALLLLLLLLLRAFIRLRSKSPLFVAFLVGTHGPQEDAIVHSAQRHPEHPVSPSCTMSCIVPIAFPPTLQERYVATRHDTL